MLMEPAKMVYPGRGRVYSIYAASPTITAHIYRNRDEGLIGWPRS